jgi:hypothetical protein
VMLLAILIYQQVMWNPTATQALGTLWFILAQRCNKSHSDTSSPIPSNNQFLNMELRVRIRTGRDKYMHQRGFERKRLNFHIMRTNRTGKNCRSVERYHAYVLSSKRTLENGRGRL